MSRILTAMLLSLLVAVPALAVGDYKVIAKQAPSGPEFRHLLPVNDGVLDPAEGAVRYILALDVLSLVTLDAAAADFDVVLEVWEYDPLKPKGETHYPADPENLKFYAGNDDRGDKSQDARVRVSLAPGVYEVEVSSLHAGGGGSFRLTLDLAETAHSVDTDNDGLTDLEETARGTNALDADTDNDGFSDGAEALNHNTDPLDHSHVPGVCIAPAAVVGVAASDGTVAEGIEVEWNDVSNANVEYQVYRARINSFGQAEAVSGWIANNTFLDTDTEVPPALDLASTGCAVPLPLSRYYYWVLARTGEGCVGPAGASDSGFRGQPEEKSLFARVAPGARDGDGNQAAPEDSPLAIRLRGASPIEPASVQGRVVSDKRDVTAPVVWWANSEDGRDGWAVCVPEGSWLPGEVLRMTASARTVDGEVIGPLMFTFVVSLPAKAEGVALWQPGAAEIALDGAGIPAGSASPEITAVDAAALPQLPGDAPAYMIEDGAFETPRIVWLPLTEGLTADNAEVWYYLDNGLAEPGWRLGEDIAGWLGGAGYWSATVDGVAYLGFLVNHGGVVCLAKAPIQYEGAVVIGTGSVTGDILLLVGAMAALAISKRRARRRA